jgi:hypothetical protein
VDQDRQHQNHVQPSLYLKLWIWSYVEGSCHYRMSDMSVRPIKVCCLSIVDVVYKVCICTRRGLQQQHDPQGVNTKHRVEDSAYLPFG